MIQNLPFLKGEEVLWEKHFTISFPVRKKNIFVGDVKLVPDIFHLDHGRISYDAHYILTNKRIIVTDYYLNDEFLKDLPPEIYQRLHNTISVPFNQINSFRINFSFIENIDNQITLGTVHNFKNRDIIFLRSLNLGEYTALSTLLMQQINIPATTWKSYEDKAKFSVKSTLFLITSIFTFFSYIFLGGTLNLLFRIDLVPWGEMVFSWILFVFSLLNALFGSIVLVTIVQNKNLHEPFLRQRFIQVVHRVGYLWGLFLILGSVLGIIVNYGLK